MTFESRDRDGESPRRTVDRRDVLRSAGSLTLSSLLAPSVLADDGGAVDASPVGPGLPSEAVTERHDVALTPAGKHGDEQVIPERRVVYLDRTVEQVNLRTLDHDDVARPQCNGGVDPGVQHRFVATMLAYTAKRDDLSYYYERYHRDRIEGDTTAPARNPSVQGLRGNSKMGTLVRLDDDGSCGSASLRINSIHQGTYDLGAITGDDETLYGSYSRSDLEDDVDRFYEELYYGNAGNVPNEQVPEDSSSLANQVSGALFVLDETTGKLDERYSRRLASGTPKLPEDVDGIPHVDKIGHFGTALDVYMFLEEYANVHAYEENTDWGENYVSLGAINAENADGGDVLVNFVDFTVTVPTGERASVTVQQEYEANDGFAVGGVYGQHSPNDHLLNEKSWTIDVPGLDNAPPVQDVFEDDAYSVPRIRHANTPTVERPNPKIVTSRTGRTDADAIEFSANCSVPENGNTAYRWRIYKLGGIVRPATFFRKSFTFGPEHLHRELPGPRGPGTTKPFFSAFGPGKYVVDLAVRNAAGETGTDVARFEVEDGEDVAEGTTAVGEVRAGGRVTTGPTSVLTVSTGETVEFDATGSVGHDGTEDSVALHEWTVEYPEAVTGRVAGPGPLHGQSVGYSFQYPGMHRVVLRVYAPDWDVEDPGTRAVPPQVVDRSFAELAGIESGQDHENARAHVDRREFPILVKDE